MSRAGAATAAEDIDAEGVYFFAIFGKIIRRYIIDCPAVHQFGSAGIGLSENQHILPAGFDSSDKFFR